jgi:hypothetical protein
VNLRIKDSIFQSGTNIKEKRMTKQDFELIAGCIFHIQPKLARAQAAWIFCMELSKENEVFDASHFLRACGLKREDVGGWGMLP